MGKKIQILICMGILTGLLFACASNNGREEKEKEEIASGGGISGQAVSDEGISERAVSETAVSAEKPKKEKYKYCNSYCLYYSTDNSEQIIEYKLSDGSERKLDIGSPVTICYVDDEWVYYMENIHKSTEPGFRSELYRAPIEKKKLNIAKAEQIFTGPAGIQGENMYCDERYLVCSVDQGYNSYYRKYDLKERKYIRKQMKDEDKITYFYGVAGGAAFYCGSEGVMRQDLDSEELIKITNYSFGSTNEYDGQIAMTDSDVFYVGDDFFREEDNAEEIYQQYLDSDDGLPMEIGQYHLADNSNKKIISHDQMKSLLIQEGFIDAAHEKIYEYYPERLFVSDDRLYIQMDIKWIKKNVKYQNKAVFSQKTGKEGGLRYEKGLTECLANPEKDQKEFEKTYDPEYPDEAVVFVSRGGCLYMAEGKCFMYLYDSSQDRNRVACYDLVSGKFKFLTKKDPDWYLPYYNGVIPYWKSMVDITAIEEDMPNNKRVDWPYW